MKQKLKLLSAIILVGISMASISIAQTVTGSGTNNYVTKFTSTGSTVGKSSIFDNGNVGIGTNAPAALLHLYSTAGVGTYTQIIEDGNADGGLKIGTSGAGASATLQSYRISTSGVDKLLLNPNGGNVGIGTTGPGKTLDVYNSVASRIRVDGPLSTEPGFEIGSVGTTKWLLYRPANTADLRFYDGSVDAITFKAGGDVGIGTTTPGAKLEVAGQVKITGGTPGAGKILVSDANGLASWSTVGANGGWSTTGNAGTVDGTNFIGTTDDIPFNIRVNNQKAGRIDRALYNTFFGYQTGNANTTGYINTASGHQALYSNTTGYGNTANGYIALYSNTTGSLNVACGNSALQLNTTGNHNTATGRSALSVNTTGSYNTAVNQALVTNTTGNYNTGVGYGALGLNYTGSYNTALGYEASPVGSNGSNSMFLGNQAGYWGGNNTIVLGNGNIEYLHCQVNLTVDSDKRVKDDIKENVPGLAFISKLRPVTYHYNIHRKDEIFGVKNDHNWDGKYDIEKRTMTGFIAQEVEQSANQIGYDFSGVDKPQNDKSIYGLRYAEFVVPLVKAVQEQQQMIDSLKAETANQNAINKSLQQQIDNLISNNSNHSNSINNSNAVNTNIDLNDKNVVVLEQNIPNPFSDQTIINYNLPDNFARAQIIFIDQSGKLIKAVDLTEKGSGTLNVFASDLTNGIYTYSLIVDGQTIETKKMMKIK